MSHFTVLVIGDDPDEQLAPYHEFECTGVNDEYIQEIDKTEEYREEYESRTETLLKSPEGELVPLHDDRFYREKTEEEKSGGPFPSRQVHDVPDDWEAVEKPKSETQSFAEFIEDWAGHSTVLEGEKPNLDGEHKYGYTVIGEDGEVIKSINRTNPNAKWDWWVVGGRWTGMLKLKEGAKGQQGDPGLMTDSAPEGWVDSALKGDIDWEGMQYESLKRAEKKWQEYQDLLQKEPVATANPKVKKWKQWWEDNSYPNDSYPTTPQEDFDSLQGLIQHHYDIHCAQEAGVIGFFDSEVPDHDEYIERQSWFGTYAVVKDSEWYAKGEMGWWGISSESEDEAKEWEGSFYEQWIEPLDDDTLITIVDCHI